jgi:hypothetical protein
MNNKPFRFYSVFFTEETLKIQEGGWGNPNVATLG